MSKLTNCVVCKRATVVAWFFVYQQDTASDMWTDAFFVLLLSGTIMYVAHPSGVTCQA